MSSPLFQSRLFATAAAVTIWAAFFAPASAIEISNYSPAVNDRFSSGFPSNPVPNTSGSFVGAAYDWSGVGWSTADAATGFGFITPQHYLVANHYGGSATIRLQSNDGTLRTVSQASVTNTGYGVALPTGADLSVGRLTAAMPAAWQIANYSVLDLNSSSVTNNSYNGQPLLVYGRGTNSFASPRVGPTAVNGTVLSGSNSYVTSSLTGSNSVQLQGGDSGSPIFIPWTNPVGGAELMILGNNVGYDATNDFYNYLANSTVMGAINGIITPDGFALRVQGNISASWTGGVNSSVSNNANWTTNSRTDLYVGFNADGVVPTTVNMNASANFRGIYFGSGTGATQGFTFSGANELTIGRGGLTNYSPLRQTFSANLVLGDHQYWDVGPGGVTAAAINTSGKLLEIAGSGTARITGAVSGTGGLALSGHRLELTGSSSYTGGTWAHSGTLVVDGNIAASRGVAIDAGAALGGTGRVSAISGAGLVGPGNSPGILTGASVDPSGGLDFTFEFTKTGAPIWATGTASGNDVLRLTASSSPFTTALGAANAVDVYLGVTSLANGDTFQGGFFTDASASFRSSIQNATFTYYVLGNGAGTAKTYNGQGYYLLDTSFWPSYDSVTVSTVSVASATFADGTVTNGQVMQLVVVPEPAAIGLALMGAAIAAATLRRT